MQKQIRQTAMLGFGEPVPSYYRVVPSIATDYQKYMELVAIHGFCPQPFCWHYDGHLGLHRTRHQGSEIAFPWPQTLAEATKLRLNNQMTSDEYETFVHLSDIEDDSIKPE